MPAPGEGIVRRAFELVNQVLGEGRDELIEEWRELVTPDLEIVPLLGELEGVS